MSHNISFSTADKADVLAFLGSRGELSENRQRVLGTIREQAEAHQRDLDRQRAASGQPARGEHERLTIPDALDHLLDGHADSEAEAAGNAYNAALQHVIACNGSDPDHLGTYSAPSRFFGLVDDAMRGLGVPADLLPGSYLYAGPPTEIPFSIPSSVDGYPAIGHLPLAKAKAAADAYRAVVDRLDHDFRYDVQVLIETLEYEHKEWVDSQDSDWYSQDTIFFSLT
ncbi:DUF7691 family protein [Saccharopolyspora shandongensis]|uniref:DUF7691 family protein n=1 Tax=Saccharopolyspora shandongensis TaxID=418495 RepID=UPI0033C7D567